VGLRNWLHNKHMSDPADGMLQLTSCSAGAYDAAYSNCRMQGVVTAPGLAPTAVEHVCLAPTRKWPQPGQTIPVVVDRADPTELTPEQAATAVSGGAAAGLQPATARVLAAHEVPIPAGMPGAPPAGLVDLTLDVALPDGGGYATNMRIGFSTPEKRAKVATVGLTLPVLINPAARDQIAIDTGRLG
jgi:hypothetical protein